jgi:cytochrome b pre-mRNA-processing protein 3
MDRSLRELGVTDLGVPNKVKKMGNVFYGLVGALGEALDKGGVAEVGAVVVKNVYGGENTHAATLAAYLIDEAQRLAAQPIEAVTHATGAAA